MKKKLLPHIVVARKMVCFILDFIYADLTVCLTLFAEFLYKKITTHCYDLSAFLNKSLGGDHFTC